MTADRIFGVFSSANVDRKDRDFLQRSHSAIQFVIGQLAIEYLQEIALQTISFKPKITS